MLTALVEIIFWLLLVLSIYSYFLYPVLLWLLGKGRGTASGTAPPPEGAARPTLSVIVAAHNEASRIREKLENLLALPYDGEREILVASDASTDGTDQIVREYSARGVALVRNDKHEGKEAAQQRAILRARGELLVFSDVATQMKGDVLTRIADHFRDVRIGAISSTDAFLDRDGRSSGEGAYVRYEMLVRRLESKVGSLVGLSGSFFAVRAAICRKYWATNVPSDFMAAVNCVRSGYRAISAEDVVGYYQDLKDPAKEYARKVRTVVRGMRAIAETPTILNPRSYGLFALQIWSHKVMRWLAPWFLLPLFGVTIALLSHALIYQVAFALQLAFYGLFATGVLSHSARRLPPVRVPYYFCMANIAVMHAALDFVRGKSVITWVPSER